MYKVLMMLWLCGFAVWPMLLQAQQKPLWFGAPESPPYYVVPARAAQQIQLNGQPVLLAFSADSSRLAVATSADTGRVNEFGNVRAAELYWLATQQNQTPPRADLLISQDVTAPFAVYGAPAVSLGWQGDNVNLVISNGDDEISRLTYLSTEHRLQNPDIFATIVDEEIAENPLAVAMMRCFPDWPAEVIRSGVNGLNSHWLVQGKTAAYQASYRQVADDIWYLDLKRCQRNQLLAVPDSNRRYWSTSHVGTVVAGDKVLLVVRQQQTRGDGQSVLMLFSEQPADTPLAKRRWQSVNTGHDNNLRLEMLGQVRHRQLFQLVSSSQPCNNRVLSLSAQGLAALQVDGHRICQAAVSAQGHLALTLATGTDKAAAERLADQLWLLQPGFLQLLP